MPLKNHYHYLHITYASNQHTLLGVFDIQHIVFIHMYSRYICLTVSD